MQRISRYHKGIQKGLIKVDAVPEVIFETPVTAVLDAHDGMGQLVAYKAMNMAIEKAKKSGIAIVSVRNSNHYGIAGYYAKMASDEGLMGMSCTKFRGDHGSYIWEKGNVRKQSYSCGNASRSIPVLFDASTSVVTRGKLEMYNKAEKELPAGWALDAQGKPSKNAGEVLGNIVGKRGGGIVPLGGNEELTGSHKGYGYGMLCELFSSILSMGMTSNHTHVDGKAVPAMDLQL